MMGGLILGVKWAAGAAGGARETPRQPASAPEDDTVAAGAFFW
jgi:hypothetical protein